MIFVGLAVLSAGGIFLSRKFYDSFFCFMLAVGLAAMLAIFLLVASVNRIGVGGELIKVEQVRTAATTADPAAFRDIYNKVLYTNELISENHWYRTQWWARDFVSARWDTVKVIPLH